MARTGGRKSAPHPYRSKRPAKSSGSLLWLQGLACGAVVTLATPTALLAVLLLAPAIVAALFDPSRGRLAARPVLIWGLAASVQPVVALWTGGHTNAHALALAGDLSILATAWAAQAAAWLFTELVPLFIVVAQNAGASAQAARLRAMRARYEAEWDLPAVDK